MTKKYEEVPEHDLPGVEVPAEDLPGGKDKALQDLGLIEKKEETHQGPIENAPEQK